MAKLGQETGTLDQMMKSLSDAIMREEDRLIKAVKNAVTYPAMIDPYASCSLICPVCKGNAYFSKVYEQLGAEMSPVAQSRYPVGWDFQRGGSCFSGTRSQWWLRNGIAAKMGIHVNFIQNVIRQIKNRSKIAQAIAKKTFHSCSFPDIKKRTGI